MYLLCMDIEDWYLHTLTQSNFMYSYNHIHTIVGERGKSRD